MTGAPHGLQDYAAVQISGIANANAQYFDGQHVAFGGDMPSGARSQVFCFRAAQLPETDFGPTSPLFCTVTPILHRFDQVMAGIPEAAVVHLAPGTYESRGFSGLYTGYLVRPGQQILGAGIGATTIKLVLPIDAINQTTLLGHFGSVTADGLYVANLTLDCNADGHVAPYGIFPAPVTCGAINVAGSFIRIERVRVINFCVQARAECFGIFVSGGVMNVIEHCIMERPGRNNTHESTLLFVTADPYATAIASAVRQNYVNCAYVRPDGSVASSEYVAVDSIDQDDNDPELFTLKTKRPHFRDTSNNVLITGILPFSHLLNGSFPVVEFDPAKPDELVFNVVGAPPNESFNGTFTFGLFGAFIGADFHGAAALGGTGCVTEGNKVFDCTRALYTDTGSTRDVVVRDNYYSSVYRGVDFDFNPDSGGVENPRLARTGVNLASLTYLVGVGNVALAGSASEHKLTTGDQVQISGALVNSVPANGSYNGTYTITKVDDFQFTYPMANPPPEHPSNPGTPANADEPTTDDPILVGIFSLTRDANPLGAILETSQEHQLRVGEAVRITGARIGSNEAPSGTYNDTYSVDSVMSPKKFSYIMKSNPGAAADPSTSQDPIRFQSLWQVRRMVFEQNACDLYRYDATSVPAGYALVTYGYEFGPPYMFPHAITRYNWIRFVDGGPLPTASVEGAYLGLRLHSCENHLVEGNVVDIPGETRINFVNCGKLAAFNNVTPPGRSMPLSQDVGNNSFARMDSLEDRIQHAVALSIL